MTYRVAIATRGMLLRNTYERVPKKKVFKFLGTGVLARERAEAVRFGPNLFLGTLNASWSLGGKNVSYIHRGLS
ncbi:MAG: hypothetical protein SAK29_32625 [Scytonema sp. PMC 1069.18]|nr:hypothetical protein [Scytonema sp. PMC 1069.18]MEC4881636.1 hypothetical protein [Scytonema sp. PMC 1070.18]